MGASSAGAADRHSPPPTPPPPRHSYPSPLVKQELAKLGSAQKLDPDTRHNALAALRAVVEEHLHSPCSLQRFVHQLEESGHGRRHAAPIVSHLARTHGPRLSPHVHRLLHILLHTLLESASCPHLQSDCASALSSLASHAIPPSSSSSSSSAAGGLLLLRRLSHPLISLLSHKVQVLSSGAAACLCSLLASHTWHDFADPALVSKLCSKAAAALLTSRSAHTVPHLTLLRSLASTNHHNTVLLNSATPILRFLLHHLLLPSASNLSSWQLRVAGLQLLEALLVVADVSTLAANIRPAMHVLARCRLDKMPHVRKAAIAALKAAEEMAAREDVKQRMAEIEEVFPDPANGSARSALTNTMPSTRLNTKLILGSPPSPSSPPAAANTLRRTNFDNSSTSSSIDHHALKQTAACNPALACTTDFNGSSDEVSTTTAGNATTADESDYFCAYFLYDTKEKVSCRKIVHHIHDINPSSIVPNSPLQDGRKVGPVPPLCLASIGHEVLTTTASDQLVIMQQPKANDVNKKPEMWIGGSGVQDVKLEYMDRHHHNDMEAAHEGYSITELADHDDAGHHDSISRSDSVSTRQVRVFQSHDELLVRCGVKDVPELKDPRMMPMQLMQISEHGKGDSRENSTKPYSSFEVSSVLSGPPADVGSQLVPEVMTKIVEADERQYSQETSNDDVAATSTSITRRDHDAIMQLSCAMASSNDGVLKSTGMRLGSCAKAYSDDVRAAERSSSHEGKARQDQHTTSTSIKHAVGASSARYSKGCAGTLCRASANSMRAKLVSKSKRSLERTILVIDQDEGIQSITVDRSKEVIHEKHELTDGMAQAVSSSINHEIEAAGLDEGKDGVLEMKSCSSITNDCIKSANKEDVKEEKEEEEEGHGGELEEEEGHGGELEEENLHEKEEENVQEKEEEEEEEETSSSSPHRDQWSVRDNPMADSPTPHKLVTTEETEEKDTFPSSANEEEIDQYSTHIHTGIATAATTESNFKESIDDEGHNGVDDNEGEDVVLRSEKMKEKICNGSSKSCMVTPIAICIVMMMMVAVHWHFAFLSHESSKIPPT